MSRQDAHASHPWVCGSSLRQRLSSVIQTSRDRERTVAGRCEKVKHPLDLPQSDR